VADDCHTVSAAVSIGRLFFQVRARSDVTVVTVHVDDVNDNAPTFVFPNSVNNTVHVTSAALSATSSGPGHLLVAVCEATDPDDGPNARLTYEIVTNSSNSAAERPIRDRSGTSDRDRSGSSDRFRIGRTSGRLTMRVGRARTGSGSGSAG